MADGAAYCSGDVMAAVVTIVFVMVLDGLATSTVLNLLVFPVLYFAFGRFERNYGEGTPRASTRISASQVQPRFEDDEQGGSMRAR